jgi:hypothetical protein
MKRSGLDKRGGFKKKIGFKARTGFKKKTGLENGNGLKHVHKRRSTASKRNNNSDPRSNEIHKCDRAFSTYIRISSSDARGICKCFTCEYSGFWKRDGIECGHFKSRQHLATRWMILNANPQCTRCNQMLDGNLEPYKEALLEVHGDNILDYLEEESNKITSLSVEDVRDIRLKIEARLKKVKEEKGL